MFSRYFADGIKAQMAHAKSVNRKKNFEDMTDSPRHMPIGGERPRERDEVFLSLKRTQAKIMLLSLKSCTSNDQR